MDVYIFKIVTIYIVYKYLEIASTYKFIVVFLKHGICCAAMFTLANGVRSTITQLSQPSLFKTSYPQHNNKKKKE
jgi:hypothetical protein